MPEKVSPYSLGWYVKCGNCVHRIEKDVVLGLGCKLVIEHTEEEGLRDERGKLILLEYPKATVDKIGRFRCPSFSSKK